MGNLIIKVSKNEDLYVEWSTITDNWVRCGTRDEMEAYGISEDRLKRADTKGTSYMVGKLFSWEDEYFQVKNLPLELSSVGTWNLPRKNLLKFIDITENESVDLDELRKILVFEEWE